MILATWLDMRVAESLPSDTTPRCSAVKFVSGSGVRLRESADPASKVILILKFNQEVCLQRQQGEWSEIRMRSLSATGWIPSQFLSVKYTETVELVLALFKAEGKNDLHSAIQIAERLLDFEKLSESEVRQDLIDRLVNYHSKLGNKKKAASIRSMRGAPLESESQDYHSQSSLFGHWFYHTFEGSSQYEAEHFATHWAQNDLILVFDELERVRKSDEEYLRVLNTIAYQHPRFFAKLYHIAFSPNAPAAFVKLRPKLHDPKLIRFVLPNRNERGLNGPVVSALTSKLVNRPEIIQTIMESCESGDLSPIWKLLSEKHVRTHYIHVVRCSSAEDLSALLVKFNSIVSVVVLIDLTDNKSIEKEKLAVFYSHLPELDRSDPKIIERLMSFGADIHTSLPVAIRSTARMRDYAAKWSSCESIVSADSKDEELLKRAAAFPTEACLKKVHPKLKSDFNFATWAVGRRPDLVTSFDVKFQIDPRMINLLVNLRYHPNCPFKKIPMEMGIKEVRRLAESIQDCRVGLQPHHFDDPQVYRSVLDSKLTYQLLAQLPKRFWDDPLIVTNLPVRHETNSEYELFRSFANSTTIRNVVAKFGLSRLGKIKSEHALEEYYDANLQLCLINTNKFDWSEAIQAAKERGESCNAWQELVAECRLGEPPGHSIVEKWNEFPFEEVNRVFGCDLSISKPEE
ncbi:MAG TPA: SH3 domain-containing protein [Pseudobdellovibrionaceae bacterium]|nr:SH3 domain-containing protein [Pseudobdellovibrionaceae bacterium]